MLRLSPKTLALSAVQRQTAASRSARPWIREQHGCTGGEPTTTLTKLSTLAHTPSLRASLGHLPRADGVGVGFGFGLGLGLGLVEGQELQALPREKKRMLSAKKRAMEADLFEAILIFLLKTLASWLACLA
ncbi:hypothetical protein HRI_005175900 [Hibiscus trionum]|uniref:Uncharacterized protein n=1 Tax=Hibiscus trionum TaxID=183268 RepID=A0A9W7JGU2_HIBTR|nr:hypothetical protein HRI_005175900 [Hibiscus trionum]